MKNLKKQKTKSITKEAIKDYVDEDISIYYQKTDICAKGIDTLVNNTLYIQSFSQKGMAYKRVEISAKEVYFLKIMNFCKDLSRNGYDRIS